MYKKKLLCSKSPRTLVRSSLDYFTKMVHLKNNRAKWMQAVFADMWEFIWHKAHSGSIKANCWVFIGLHLLLQCIVGLNDSASCPFMFIVYVWFWRNMCNKRWFQNMMLCCFSMSAPRRHWGLITANLICRALKTLKRVTSLVCLCQEIEFFVTSLHKQLA